MLMKRKFYKNVMLMVMVVNMISISCLSPIMASAGEQQEADVAETEEIQAEEAQFNYLYFSEEYDAQEGGRLVVASIDTEADSVSSAVMTYLTAEGEKETEAYLCDGNLAGFYIPEEAVTCDDIAKISVAVAGRQRLIDFTEVMEDEDTQEIELDQDLAEELEEAIYKEEVEAIEELIAQDTAEIEQVLEHAESYSDEEKNTADLSDAAVTTDGLAGVTTNAAPMVSASAGNVIVVIDPGHGGTDSGATATYNGRTYTEKAQVLKIAKAAKEELESYYGVTVYMTRTTDKYLSLTERVNYAKSKNATVLVSMHLDSGSSSASGAHIILSKGAYRPELAAESKGIAAAVLKELSSAGFPTRSSGGYTYRSSSDNTRYSNGTLADYYGIIRQSTEAGFASMIIEHAFMSNSSDMKKLSQDSELKKIGIADAKGIASYYGLSRTKPAEYYTSNPGFVTTNKKMYVYSDTNFKNKTGKSYARGDVAVITGIGYSSNGLPKLKVNGGYISANKEYSTKTSYYTSNPGFVTADKKMYIYSDVNSKNKTGKSYAKGDVVVVKGISYSSNGLPKLKVNGGYISANEAYSTRVSYYTSNPGSVKVNKKMYVYSDTDFKNKTGKSYASGTTVRITGIGYSSNGLPKLKVSGGYISANKAYSAAVSK